MEQKQQLLLQQQQQYPADPLFVLSNWKPKELLLPPWVAATIQPTTRISSAEPLQPNEKEEEGECTPSGDCAAVDP